MRTFAFIIGLGLLLFGIAGMFPHFYAEGYLFKIFKLNLPINLLHLIAGACGFVAGFIGIRACYLYFQIIGIVFAISGVLGFIYEDNNILGIFANNIANTWMHIITAIIALILGYGAND